MQESLLVELDVVGIESQDLIKTKIKEIRKYPRHRRNKFTKNVKIKTKYC